MTGVVEHTLRREDPRLLRGRGRYTSDITRSSMAHMAVLRSPHAHAGITSIETDAAATAPGVVAVFTAADLDGVGGLGAAPVVAEMPLPPTTLLAGGSVHFVGQPVAVVVASTEVAARDALDLIAVDYAPRPAVTDGAAALADDAPLAFPDLGTNLAYRLTRSDGDLDGAFAAAATVVRLRMAQNRIAAVPMEARGAVADWDEASGELSFWAGVQAPFRARATLAGVLGLAESQIRVIAPDVGGGFGVKGGLYAEEALAAVASHRLGRPVRWFSGRGEDLQTTQHAREQVQEVQAALTADGALLAVRVRVVCNLGAGARGAGVVSRIAQCVTGCYRVGAVATELVGVYTNTTPTGAYRGAGRPEATFIIERVMDEAAAQLGLDPAEIRRRNFVPPGAFPYRAPTGIVLDSGDYERGLAECLRLLDYEAARREQAAARTRGELVGVGLATYLELTGSGWESGLVRVLPSGEVEALTGSTDQGQGRATTWARIVASALGVPAERVAVRHGDTALLASGVGSFGSRSTAVGGGALALAASDVKAKMLQIAAHRLEVAPADLAWNDGAIAVQGAPGHHLSFREVAALAYGGGRPPGMEPGLEAVRYFNPEGEAYSSGAYAAVVAIDPATGQLTVRRFVAVDDCGTVIHARLVEGQLYGGLAQGIGQALWEHVVYDEAGQLVSGTLMDYAMPRAHMLPPIDLGRVETPSPRNPLGAKGVGEAGTIGAPPALVTAVVDALRPLGVTNVDMPLTPERLWRTIAAARQERP